MEKREEKPLNGRERQKFEPVTALRGKKAAEREEGKEVEFFFLRLFSLSLVRYMCVHMCAHACMRVYTCTSYASVLVNPFLLEVFQNWVSVLSKT